MPNSKEEFKPSGKPVAVIFSNFHRGIDNTDASAFEITRAYVGYKYTMIEQLSGNITFNVANPESGKLDQVAFLKFASLTYVYNNLSVDFGLIPTLQFKEQEKYWGHRYIFKSYADEYKLNNSVDFGTNIICKIGEKLSLDASVYNGEGYKKLQSDKTFRYCSGFTLSPIKDLIIRGYYDNSIKTYSQETVSGFVGYKYKKAMVGAEYNYQFNNAFKYLHEIGGYSVYLSYDVSKEFQVFGRYDNVSSNALYGQSTTWNNKNDGNLIVDGLQYAPTKDVAFALSCNSWQSDISGSYPVSSVFFNVKYSY